MTTKNTLTKELANKIKIVMIRGYYNEKGNKEYPTLKKASEWYNVSYDYLKQKAAKGKWTQKRKEYQQKVAQKVAENKGIVIEAEAIVVNDIEFNEAAELLRKASVQEINHIYTNPGSVKSPGYQLMNLANALEKAQKISRLSAGEPSEITKNETQLQSQSRYEVTKRLICSKEHIEHELEVLNATSKAQRVDR
jgi:hypothetical protein